MAISNENLNLIKIKEFLDEEDKLSVVFLLCDDPYEAKKILSNNSLDPPRKDILEALHEWAESCCVVNIDKKIVECLCLIQHYKALRKCGYEKNNEQVLKMIYGASQAHYIDVFRKALFLTCDKLTVEQLKKLIELVTSDLGDDTCEKYEPNRMELNLLCWLCRGYICHCNMTRLIDHLKKVDATDAVNHLEDCKLNLHCRTLIHSCIHLTRHKELLPVNSTYYNTYDMDVDNIGTCVIVNQKKFSTLNYRCGTDKDRDKLEAAFLSLGFRITVLENLTHEQFETEIKDVLRTVSDCDSSFALCVLSHGIKDAVYGVDEKPIYISDIKKWILAKGCPQLAAKPKILVLQSCRNSDKLQIQRTHTTNETDGGEIQQECPPAADLLVLYSVAEGYVSYRNTSEGSIFIQALCNEILDTPSRSFSEIFLSVNNKISKIKQLDEKPICEESHTLRKTIIFPYNHEAQFIAAQKLLLHYSFHYQMLKVCVEYIKYVYREVSRSRAK